MFFEAPTYTNTKPNSKRKNSLIPVEQAKKCSNMKGQLIGGKPNKIYKLCPFTMELT